MLLQRCTHDCISEGFEVLDQVSRLSNDPFQHNRRLSETNVLDLKSFKGHCRSESHSIDQSHLENSTTGWTVKDCTTSTDWMVNHCTSTDPSRLLHHTNNTVDISYSDDNPFQNDKLPLWQGQKSAAASTSTSGSGRGRTSGSAPTVVQKKKMRTPSKAEPSMNSNMSSPDNNNYGGQVQAYKYQSLNETPTSPELANHRAMGRLNKTKTPATPPGTPEIIQVLFYFF